jgi:drug/metabolite transporter (DMT)-like permease
VLFFTPDSLTIKKINDDDGLKTVWFRMVFYAFSTSFGLLVFKGHQLGCDRALGSFIENARGVLGCKLGAAIACSHSLVEVLFCVSQKATTAANVLVVLASSPLWAALLSWGLLGERPPLRTAVTIAIGMSAVAYVFIGSTLLHDHDGSSDGQSSSSDMLGLIGANGCSFFLAAQLVGFRYGSQVMQQPEEYFLIALPLGALAGLPVVLAIGADPFGPGWTASDFGWALLGGGLCIPIALAAMSIGTNYIAAAEVSLLMLLETIAGPLWVWYVAMRQLADIDS